MRAYELKLDGKPVRVFAEKRRGVLWFHYRGQTYSIDIKPKTTKSKTGDAGAGNTLNAPMPGKILKVSGSAGDKVKARQALVVMEAMKMEYSLSAPEDGTIVSVNCNVGDQVQLGAVLVELKLAEK